MKVMGSNFGNFDHYTGLTLFAWLSGTIGDILQSETDNLGDASLAFDPSGATNRSEF